MASAPAHLIAEPFSTPRDHLMAELHLLKLLLERQVIRLRSSGRLIENAFRGLFIADEHVDAILTQRKDFSFSAVTVRIEAARNEISLRREATLATGISLPIVTLADRMSLSAFETNVLLACTAPELGVEFESLYAYVQNDVNRKRPTADLLLTLFADPIDGRDALSSDAPLMRSGIIRVVESQSFLARAFHADARVADFLLGRVSPGRVSIDERLKPFTRMLRGGLQMRNLLLPEDLKTQIATAAARLQQPGGVIVLHGPEGVGKRTLAASLGVLSNRGLIYADLSRTSLPFHEVFPLLKREALLASANLFLDHAPQQHFETQSSTLIFAATQAPPSEFRIAGAPAFQLPGPVSEQRRILWEHAAEEFCIPLDSTSLARKFNLTAGQIHDACRTASITGVTLDSAAREQSGSNLAKFAPKIQPNHSWPDLVLPNRAIQQLRAIASAHRFRDRVYNTWQFGAKNADGKGLSALFYGPSGTGKTMAAGILASDLSLDLYKIDLSTILSKYIGETEKQLSALFREAQTSNAILLFDEADALFGKRSEVKDAHDRYANVETAFLLQKIEEYEGISILTTNFRSNIDEAFSRRMQHIIEFPLPDAADRLLIWKTQIPSAAPCADDIDFGFLARQFEFTGGNIRAAAIAAAFLAAENDSEIRMSHLLLATAREMQKTGKIPSRTEFRDHFDLIHAHL